jgi:hypothetical protein
MNGGEGEWKAENEINKSKSTNVWSGKRERKISAYNGLLNLCKLRDIKTIRINVWREQAQKEEGKKKITIKLSNKFKLFRFRNFRETRSALKA